MPAETSALLGVSGKSGCSRMVLAACMLSMDSSSSPRMPWSQAK